MSQSTRQPQEDSDERRDALQIRRTIVVTGFTLALVLAVTSATYAGETSSEFSGHHVNSGMVTHEISEGKHVLTMSRDFPVPEAPDPHWRIVNSKGNLYLLDCVKLKDDKIDYAPVTYHDVAKAQFWCAFVEVVFGEASFAKPLSLRASR